MIQTWVTDARAAGLSVERACAVLGLTPVPECGVPGIFGTTGIAPGGELEGEPLASGSHLFLCLIHPWMQTEVTVQ